MAGRLRILTANLWQGRADPDGLARLVETQAVDVACVQELAAEQAEALAAVLPHGRLEPRDDYRGMGIATRHPARFGQLPLRYRPLRTAMLDPKDWPGLRGPLAVWNTHIRAPHTLPPWSLFIRRAQLRQLLQYLQAPGAPQLLLVGDLNATPLWPVYRQLTRRLRDAAAEAARRRGERPDATWAPGSSPDRRRLLRIDHALARGVEVEDVRRLHVPGSDHDALCVDVSLSGEASIARS